MKGEEHVDPVCRMHVGDDEAAAHVRIDDYEYSFCSPECLRVFLRDRMDELLPAAPAET